MSKSNAATDVKSYVIENKNTSMTKITAKKQDKFTILRSITMLGYTYHSYYNHIEVWVGGEYLIIEFKD